MRVAYNNDSNYSLQDIRRIGRREQKQVQTYDETRISIRSIWIADYACILKNKRENVVDGI